jgi:hypothetical protein
MHSRRTLRDDPRPGCIKMSAATRRREQADRHHHGHHDQDGDSADLHSHQASTHLLQDDVRRPQIAYTPAQAAIASGRTRTRIFGAIKSGDLVARKDGKATIIEHDELVRWVRTLPIIRAKAS